MPTETTVLAVVRAARRDAANASAAVVTPDAGAPFSVPLVAADDPDGPVVAYCCEWAMTNSERTTWLRAFRDVGGFRPFEAQPIPPGPPSLSRDLWLFDTRKDWVGDEETSGADKARAALGMQIPPPRG